MNNKVLVNVYVVYLDENYDIYIPLNLTLGSTIELICKTINTLADNNFPYDKGYCIMDGTNGQIYKFDTLIKNTNIRNGKKIILF